MANFEAYGLTDPGKRRANNEDAFLVDPKRGIFAVADGLGGLYAGGLASQCAVESVQQNWPPQKPSPEVFAELYAKASQSIIDQTPDKGPSGTTLTVAHLDTQNQLHWAHVGDSRIYLLGKGVLTRDDTFAQKRREECLERGAPPIVPDHYEHILTQCVGQRKALNVQCGVEQLKPGDRFALYSDGLTKTHSQDEIRAALEHAQTPQQFAEILLSEALQYGGPDNITMIAVFINS